MRTGMTTYNDGVAGSTDTTYHARPAAIRWAAKAVSINGQLIASLPGDASAALPSRGQVAVTGTIDGQPFRTVVEPDGNRGHWIKLDARLTSLRKIRPGDAIAVELAPTKDWPEPHVPEDLQSALDAATDVAGLWESITPMARWEWVRWVNATRSPTTRARRVEVSMSKMRSGKRRPCCFDLAACTDPDLARSGKLISPVE